VNSLWVASDPIRRMVSVMLGRDHALMGGLGFLIVAPIVLHDPTWQILGVGTVTSAAFALLPDIDEPGSTVSRKLGPISRSFSEMTRSLAGGHRQATHSLFFVAIVMLLTRVAFFNPLAVAILVAASFLLVFRMLLPTMLRFAPQVGLATLALAFGSGDWARHLDTHTIGAGAPSLDWLILATAGGCVWHMIGDSLTVEGVPWLWLPGIHPLQRVRIAVPVVGHTGSARESLIGGVMGVALIWLAITLIISPASHSIVVPSLHLPNIDPLSHFHVHLPNQNGMVRELSNKAKYQEPHIK
jgi:membrane-bound metal-dependent hydrolase YbcI (DUF457 family)